MNKASVAAHNLVSTLPISTLIRLVEASAFPEPCHDEAGRDLVFSSLLNPNWKSSGRHRKAGQQALVSWLKRTDVDVFALQPMPNPGKKNAGGKVYQTSFALALEMGLDSLLESMLECRSATPGRLERVRSTEAGASLLQIALKKNMLGLVRKASSVGWDVTASDPKGRSLMWHARGSEAVKTLLDLGVPSSILAEPGLVEDLFKAAPQKDVFYLLDLIQAKTKANSSLSFQKMLALLLDMKNHQIEDRYFNEERSVQGLLGLRKAFQKLVETPGNRPEECQLEITRGVFKGTLSGPALLAYVFSRESLGASTIGLLRGVEDKWFDRNPVYVRDGVTDFGLFALFAPGLSTLHNEIQNETEPPIRVWWEECQEAYKTIIQIHGEEKWLQWKIETAATLSKRPNASVLEFLESWFYDLLEPCVSGFADELQVKQSLDVLEQAASAGVLFVGNNVTSAIESVAQCIQATPKNQRLVEDLLAKRDRLLLAFLGNEEALKSKLSDLGVPMTKSWSASERDENPHALFSSFSMRKLWNNPSLSKRITRGVVRALALNAPGVHSLRNAKLEQTLPEATVEKPHLRL